MSWGALWLCKKMSMCQLKPSKQWIVVVVVDKSIHGRYYAFNVIPTLMGLCQG